MITEIKTRVWEDIEGWWKFTVDTIDDKGVATAVEYGKASSKAMALEMVMDTLKETEL